MVRSHHIIFSDSVLVSVSSDILFIFVLFREEGLVGFTRTVAKLTICKMLDITYRYSQRQIFITCLETLTLISLVMYQTLDLT